ncbi:MAG: hypothetical protein Q8P46_10475 [Hyphomicrobiales bacterium]|nr:hypothetical protein [Hyphomicrobiales bacterium]
MISSGWIAIFAVFIASGALALEVRRWFESGVRLTISVMADAQLAGGIKDDNADYLGVFVVNRGSAPTTITTLALMTFSSRWKHFRMQQDYAAIVPNPQPPGSAPNLPQEIGPNARWTGLIRYDDKLHSLRDGGNLWVCIYGSHSDKPTMARVPVKQPSREGIKKL